MTAAPTVEVLIVSYNGRDRLAACLASLESIQPNSDALRTRIRVLDNASPDASADMVAADFPGIELERSASNLGFARGNNRLVSSSVADYVLLLNPDTVLTEDVISPLRVVLDSDPRIAIVGPRLLFPDGTGQPSGERLPTLRYELARNLHGTKAEALLRPLFDLAGTLAATRELHLHDAGEPRTVEFLWATCWLARTADLRRYGPFDEYFTTYDEDVDLCRRLADDGRLAMYVPSVSVVHVGGASSDPERKRCLMRTGRDRYYRRHGGIPAALTYRAITRSTDVAKRLTRTCRRG